MEAYKGTLTIFEEEEQSCEEAEHIADGSILTFRGGGTTHTAAERGLIGSTILLLLCLPILAILIVSTRWPGTCCPRTRLWLAKSPIRIVLWGRGSIAC